MSESEPLVPEISSSRMGAAMSVLGNMLAATTLLTGDVVTSTVTWFARRLVDVIDCVCGSGHNTARRKVEWHAQRYATDPVYTPAGKESGELDVEATLARSKYPIAPDALIEKAREIIATEFGTVAGCDASCLAPDFQFVAPIVGPLSKSEFLQAFGSFKLKDALDMKDNSWFQVDPVEPNRVWWFSRAMGKHTGTMKFGGTTYAGDGKEILLPPIAQSMLFDENGRCYTLTVGYSLDKRIGNTEGLGAMFGIMKAIGKPLPFPEAQRSYTPSLRFEGFEHIAKGIEAMGFKTV